MSSKFKRQAFTLIELSIVILIISILISGGLSVSSSAIQSAKVRITKERVNQIYKAMGAYLLINKKLPCPASLTDAKSVSANYGVEGACATSTVGGMYVSTNAPLLNYGLVPVVSLGLPKDMAEDGFGNKLVYVVDRTFANISGYAHNVFGSITIKENNGSTDQTVVPSAAISSGNDKAVFVIISTGANGFGAFGSDSTSISSAPTDTREIENYLGSTTGTASFDYNFFSQVRNSDSFDDYLFFKTRNALLLDFDALSLIKCTSTSQNYDDVGNCDTGNEKCLWPDATYGQIVISSSNCKSTYLTTVSKPTKKCLAFGVWQEGAINSCTN